MKIEIHEDKIRFYTPYSEDNKRRCSAIPTGKWNRKLSCWEYSIDVLPDIVEEFQLKSSAPEVVQAYRGLCARRDILTQLKSGEIEPDAHPFLMRHQRLCRHIAKYYNDFAFFLDTGTGKTVTALQVILDKGGRFLIVCPKSIIKTAWLADARTFFKGVRLLPISRNMNKADYAALAKEWGVPVGFRTTAALKEELCGHADAFVINPESYKADKQFIAGLNITGLILDESTMIKNAQSQIAKDLIALSDTLEHKYILSGKPAPNNEIEYFPQLRVVNPCVFGDSFFRFKALYFDPYGYMGYQLKLKEDKRFEFMDRLGMRSIFITKQDCLDLPEKTYLVRSIELTDKIRRIYRQMEQEQFMQLEDLQVPATNKLAALMKLRQMTGGWIIDEQGVPTKLHNAKEQELQAVLDEIGDNQVIIWAEFQHEIASIAAMLGDSAVTAYSKTKNVDESIEAFKTGRAKYIIAHPKTLRFGVTFTQCTYAIYYSRSYSYEDYYQSHDRIYRKGQTQPCTFIFLVCEDTIDEVMDTAIEKKHTAAEIIEAFLRVRKG